MKYLYNPKTDTLTPLPDKMCIIDLEDGEILTIGNIEEKELEAVEGHKRKYTRKEKKVGRGARKCSVCGKVGHSRRTCTEGDEEGPENNNTNFVVDEDTKEEITVMLSEGKGSREIAEYYGVDIKTANFAIAKAKGITLPR